MARVACFLFVFALVFGQIYGESVFRFASVFGNHMVLQKAPMRASVWGYGEVGEEVVLIHDGEMYRSFITAQVEGESTVGIWTVMLTPTMFGGPYLIKAYSKVKGTISTITLTDVMFGDVWMCSGQSNMEFTVVMSDNGAKAINESADYPDIRLFTAELDCESTPQLELKKVRLPWSRASPETVGGPAWQYFSAVCWYYGVQLYKELGYPIGLVASTWGGTPVEAWSSPDALASCDIKDNSVIKDNRKFAPHDLHLFGPRNLSCLWNAMIVPFLNVSIYGAIWYQGEENAERPLYPYNCTFPAMIDDWRAKWYDSTTHNTDETFPFGFVQLSAVGNDTEGQSFNFAPLRWDQTAQYGFVPNDRQKNVFMAVAMDLGNPNSPYGSIHPTDKTDVGNRLALAGLDVAYGRERYYSGPLVDTIKKQTEPPSAALEVTFKSLNAEIELRSNFGFEVMCENGTEWLEASILNHSSTSVIIMPNMPSCVAVKVRYAWSDDPCPKLKCAIYSGDLPSPPFVVDGPFEAGDSKLLQRTVGIYA
ncbi:sialate O-acetylesterase-like [Dendronephthya gigantea]|uniref:sialate O-acetylesterase-like n=1 Tax=Dendronephthya gigantea TaxID=151771 RepID=UPI00106ADED6|nr:sialate O-acetylesterase-like [Dendronephthya gigantea]